MSINNIFYGEILSWNLRNRKEAAAAKEAEVPMVIEEEKIPTSIPAVLPERRPNGAVQKRPTKRVRTDGDPRPAKKRKTSDMNCIFKDDSEYRNYFRQLLFADLSAKIIGEAQDAIFARRRCYDALAVAFNLDRKIANKNFYKAKIQILGNADGIDELGGQLMLLVWASGHQKPETLLSHHQRGPDLPENHTLALIRKRNQHGNLDLQCCLHKNDPRIPLLFALFTTIGNERRRRKLSVILIDGINNRKREFTAIENIDKVHLRNFLIKPHLAEPRPYDIWENVPKCVKDRLHRNLNPSQFEGVHASCNRKGVSLIQGPPGTGKTKTLIHLLNAMHISLMQKFFITREKNSFKNCWISRAERAKTGQVQPPPNMRSHLENFFAGKTQLITGIGTQPRERPPMHSRLPKLLVCAPSNAAVDEIAQRLIEEDLVDGSGIAYRPPVVRVTSKSGSSVRAVVGETISLDAHIEAFMQWNEKRDELKTRITMVKNELQLTSANLKLYENQLKKTYARFCRDDFVENQTLAHNYKGDIQRWAMMKDTLKTHATELARLRIVYENPPNVASEKLKLHIMEDAQIIFATLNMTGSKYFEKLKKAGKIVFDYCIIDEAAQCTEPDILIPLQLGVESLILVGDPEQLPATVFAQGNEARQFERSLFERLRTAGMQVHLLTIQYRMHPEIVAFPSGHFYQDKLCNGPNVCSNDYLREFHQNPNFLPFLFFSLSESKQQKIGHSWLNHTEARFVVSHLEYAFNCFPEALGESTIGIITPYINQRNKIRDLIAKSNILREKEIDVATVDFFQGREKDIIVLSTVRASAGGVGFVADIRRMNVAITRAKHALWVVGNPRALGTNHDWKALMESAYRRKLVREITLAA